MAHGLDQVYPTKHRQTAIDMIHQGGGLVTEFLSGTHIEKSRFVQRNRIVAGMADATLIVQGAEKSGSMVTARLTHDYDRELFCCPGRADDELSSGCNRLIQRQMAHMALSVDDVLETMNWPNELLRQQTLQEGVQQELFPNLTPEEERIVASLRDTDGLHLNDICERCALSVGDVSSLLFTLELKGLVRQGAGGRYSL
jgi:DNA processing protein